MEEQDGQKSLKAEDLRSLVDKIAMAALERSPPGKRQAWAINEIEGLRQEMLAKGDTPEHVEKFCSDLAEFVSQAIRLLEVNGGGAVGRA